MRIYSEKTIRHYLGGLPDDAKRLFRDYYWITKKEAVALSKKVEEERGIIKKIMHFGEGPTA